MSSLILILVITAMCSAVMGEECFFPKKMSGMASAGHSTILTFSIDLNAQTAIFRSTDDESAFRFINFKTHKMYDKFSSGICRTTNIDRSLKMPLGIPSGTTLWKKWNTGLASYSGKAFNKLTVSVKFVSRSSTICYPEGLPLVLTAPNDSVSDLYSVRSTYITDPSKLKPDITNCEDPIVG